MGCASSSPNDPISNGMQQPSSKKRQNESQKDMKEGDMVHTHFSMGNTGKITDFYDIEKKRLGEGSYGSTHRARNKATSAVRAIKTISKSEKNTERLKDEIAIMRFMDNPHIIKLYESFEDDRSIYLVTEFCNGGELFDRIVQAGHFTESQAAPLMQQIFSAIAYMHTNNICHRDLKPENFCFMSKGPIEKNILKIKDFSLSCMFEPGQKLTRKAGTPYYVAPEVLAGKYDQSSDMWSCGVIMYVMLCGYPPFLGETDAQVLSKVRLGHVSFNAADWKTVTEDAKTLIRFLLKKNRRDRYTAEQALNHDWIKKKAAKAPNFWRQHGLIDSLRGFRWENKLKKLALQSIAGQLNEDQIRAQREAFMSMDHNSDGIVTLPEVKKLLSKAGLKNIPIDLERILEDDSAEGKCAIDYTKFLAATLERHLYTQEDVCWSAFRLFDHNGDGKISKEELAQVLSNGNVEQVTTSDTDPKMLMAQVDKDGDGEINFEEFMTMMRSK